MYLLWTKPEVFDKFVQLVKLAKRQVDSRLKVLRSANGGDYKLTKLTKFCTDRGIIQKLFPPYTLEMNGAAERINWTLVECVRCMLEHARAF